jgi:beta-lactamase superfamily II metal-dependent hydrolase
MSTRIHFLNVEDGDCSIIERPQSGRHTVIDICCGNDEDIALEETEMSFEHLYSASGKPKGNFNQKSSPTNSIEYIKSINIDYIHRFILTHPDMDHMDGLENLFSSIRVTNFWDTGVKRDSPHFSKGKYKENDWKFYQQLISNHVSNVKVISPKAGEKGKYWSYDEEGYGNGDYLSIISPTNELVTKCDPTNFNDASYVVVYNESSAGSVIFAGDSEDGAWENILKNYESLVKNAAVLFAPHHGRDSNRDWAFLDVVNPRVSFLGNAKSKHLGYQAWQNRNLTYFTNNQCGNVRINFDGKEVVISIENYDYANQYTEDNTYEVDSYWFLIKC